MDDPSGILPIFAPPIGAAVLAPYSADSGGYRALFLIASVIFAF